MKIETTKTRCGKVVNWQTHNPVEQFSVDLIYWGVEKLGVVIFALMWLLNLFCWGYVAIQVLQWMGVD